VYQLVSQGESHQLFLRDLRTLHEEPIPGAENGTAPFFSADGEWLGFLDVAGPPPYQIKKVSPRGGAPQVITEGVSGGISWGEDGTIVFTNSSVFGRRELWRTSSEGGESSRLLAPAGLVLDQPEVHHRWPDILPGGRAVLFTSITSYWDMSIKVLDLITGEKKTLISPGTFSRYSPTGHIVYAWGGDLLAAPFDLKALEVTGPSVVVQEDVLVGWSGNAHFGFSQNGTLFYIPRHPRALGPGMPWTAQNVLVSPDGDQERLILEPEPLYSARFSPDGTNVAGYRYNRRPSIWYHELERGTGRPIHSREAFGLWPVWTPGGDGIVFSSNLHGGPQLNLFVWRMDQEGPPVRLTHSEFEQQAHGWTSGGTSLIITEVRESGRDILVVDLEGNGTAEPLVATAADEHHPAISPDGRWLAYASLVTGRSEVFVQRYPVKGYIRQVSNGGGAEPLWAPDGRTLYYRNRGLTAVEVVETRNGEIEFGEPRKLHERLYITQQGSGRGYDITPDGSRFLMLTRGVPPLPIPPEYVVVLNWFDELERIVAQE
jgi:serine/threonine-protein kinase